MAVDPNLAGREYPPTEPYVVERGKIREFARAVQASDQGGEVAPPTFAIVVQQRGLDLLLADESAGIELSRIVHADQRFSYTRPIVAGDELVVRFRVESVRQMGDASMVVTESEVVDAVGEPVVTGRATLLVGGAE